MLRRMGDGIVIRAAAIADVPAIAAIRATGLESQAFWEGRVRGYLEGTHSPRQALPERAVWVALGEDRVIGLVAGHRTCRFECDGELQWIDVAREFRGRGIADRRVGTMLSWFRQRNLYRVCVNVASENAIARNLYAKHGAVPKSAGWMEWRDLRQSTFSTHTANQG